MIKWRKGKRKGKKKKPCATVRNIAKPKKNLILVSEHTY